MNGEPPNPEDAFDGLAGLDGLSALERYIDYVIGLVEQTTGETVTEASFDAYSSTRLRAILRARDQRRDTMQ